MKYQAEINKMFEDALRDPWDDDETWDEIKAEMEAKFNFEQMEKDIDTGIKNGYSLEYQLNLCKDILLKMKADERR